MSFAKPLSPQQAVSRFDRYFNKIQAKKPDRPVQIKIYSQKLDLDYSFPPDSTNQTYHGASIGKVFTATLVQMLAEKSVLSVKDRLHQYFSASELDQLFVYQNVDYSQQVNIEHLLGHTSGIADYFEGSTIGGKSFITQVLSNPHFQWTPQKLIDFTRYHQRAVGIPGTVFNYSDTGYILLGLIIEQVTGKSFAKNLEDEIFLPIEMHDSYLMFYSEPKSTSKKTLDKIWFDGIEISGYESLSCDWAGGGIVSTTADLLKFNQALRSSQLVQGSTLATMDSCEHKFRHGIYYGLGMMEIRFKEFFF